MYEYRFTVNRVIDGDTVDGTIDLGFGIYTKKRIRLDGINAPETRTRDKEEKARGKEVTKRLRQLLRHGQKQAEGLVITTTLDKTGKFGRVLGNIKYKYAEDPYGPWIGWKSIGEQLLEEGLVSRYEV